MLWQVLPTDFMTMAYQVSILSQGATPFNQKKLSNPQHNLHIVPEIRI